MRNYIQYKVILMSKTDGKNIPGNNKDEGFEQAKNIPMEQCLMNVPLSQICMNPYQPRTTFNEYELKGLADSIESQGLLQPILVLPLNSGGKYQLVSGERRYRACNMLGWKTIPAYVKEVRDIRVAALVENMKRKNLSPFEQAQALLAIQFEGNYTIVQLGSLIHLPYDRVQRLLSINKIPDWLKEKYANSRISKSYLYEVSKLKTPEEMEEALENFKNRKQGINDLKHSNEKKSRAKKTSVPNRAGNDNYDVINDRKYCFKSVRGRVIFESFCDVLTEDDVKDMCFKVLEEIE